MKNRRFGLAIAGYCLILSISLIYLCNKIRLDNYLSNIKGVQTINHDVSVSASIGEHTFFLFGFSSPFAQVTLEGAGIYEQTTSDKNGYFTFANRFSPLSPREACLSSRDQLGRLTSPVCLPPFPINYNANIGPVLIAPTLSLNKPNYFVGDKIILTGQTIPNTDVNLNFYVDKSKSFINYLLAFSLVRRAYASYLNGLTTKADSAGNFSFSVDASKPDFFRVFADSQFKQQNSPQSLILNLQLLPLWMIIVKLFLFIWAVIKSRLIEIIIVAEILYLLIYFLRQYFLPHKVVRQRALSLRPSQELALRPKLELVKT